MNSEVIKDFKKRHPSVTITIKRKAHGDIVYVNGQTAFNMSDIHGSTYEKEFNSLERARRAS